MNTNHIKSAARSTQSARRSYFASVASGAPAWLIKARAQALSISTERLIRECGGSERRAQAAEVAYIDGLTA